MQSKRAQSCNKCDMPLRPIGNHIDSMVAKIEIRNHRPAALLFEIAGQRPSRDINEHLAV